MKMKTSFAANFASILFLIFAGYCLYFDRTAFAVAAFIIAACGATTYRTDND